MVVRSSYGSVYKALDKRDGKIVAIKVLEVENEDTTELQKEINILRDCHSEFIVAYKGTFEKDGHIWVSVCSIMLLVTPRSFISIAAAQIASSCAADRHGVLCGWIHL